MRTSKAQAQTIRRSEMLNALGWPSLAADMRDGLPPEDALRRLSEIGEGKSDAAQLIRGWKTQAAAPSSSGADKPPARRVVKASLGSIDQVDALAEKQVTQIFPRL